MTYIMPDSHHRGCNKAFHMREVSHLTFDEPELHPLRHQLEESQVATSIHERQHNIPTIILNARSIWQLQQREQMRSENLQPWYSYESQIAH